MAATPLKSLFPNGLCQSLNRRGKPCGCRIAYLKGSGFFRCKWHGGLTTGPKTKKGLEIATRNLMNTPNWKKHLAKSQ